MEERRSSGAARREVAVKESRWKAAFQFATRAPSHFGFRCGAWRNSKLPGRMSL